MSETRKPAYWAVLPARVRYDQDLRPNAKLLYAEITALADSTGYCWASNKHLADLFGLSAKTISDLVSMLAEKGYCHVEVLRDPVSNQVTERRIWIEHPGIQHADDTPPPKNGDTPLKNEGSPPPKNGEENNIKKLNSTIPPKAPQGGRRRREPKSQPDWKPERFAKFWDFYPRGESNQAAINAWDKLKPDDALIDTMATALVAQMQREDWKRGIGIPYASTWLNQSRWEDKRFVVTKSSGANDAPQGLLEEDEVYLL